MTNTCVKNIYIWTMRACALEAHKKLPKKWRNEKLVKLMDFRVTWPVMENVKTMQVFFTHYMQMIVPNGIMTKRGQRIEYPLDETKELAVFYAKFIFL